jgi:hypothetical protein
VPVLVPFNNADRFPAQIDQAYALVRTLWPAVSLEAWRTYAAHFHGGAERGLLALMGDDAYFTALCNYERSPDLLTGTVLRVPLFLVFDILDAARLTDSLLDAVRARAEQLACDQLQIYLRSDQRSLQQHLRARGFHDHTGCFRC